MLISLSLDRIRSAARILVRLTEYTRDSASSRSLVPGGSLRAAMAAAISSAIQAELRAGTLSAVSGWVMVAWRMRWQREIRLRLVEVWRHYTSMAAGLIQVVHFFCIQ